MESMLAGLVVKIQEPLQVKNSPWTRQRTDVQANHTKHRLRLHQG